MNYQAVIFDFDYTLGDATDAIYAGFRHAFSSMGLPVPEREAVRRTVGLPVQEAYSLLTGDRDQARRETFYSLFHPVARDMQAKGVVELLPYARELLRGLKEAGGPRGAGEHQEHRLPPGRPGRQGGGGLLRLRGGGRPGDPAQARPGGTAVGAPPAGAAAGVGPLLRGHRH